ncbi:hypothetical protein Aph02nite_41130 [Actinoplanes philippinensis]|nr:hypothetical protein Aph02nite_41130 [Actinoplanes philippinensis]
MLETQDRQTADRQHLVDRVLVPDRLAHDGTFHGEVVPRILGTFCLRQGSPCCIAVNFFYVWGHPGPAAMPLTMRYFEMSPRT